MKGKKNDYSMSFFDKDGQRVLFLEYVHDTKKAERWADAKQFPWTVAKIWNRRSREFVDKIEKGVT